MRGLAIIEVALIVLAAGAGRYAGTADRSAATAAGQYATTADRGVSLEPLEPNETPEKETLVHLALKSSFPAKDTTLASSPGEIVLTFTQAPQMAGTSIRLLPVGGEPLELGKAKAREDDAKVVVLAVSSSLADGEYRVSWRAMAQDSHTVRGEFDFTVDALR